jgi:hypothetical protein
MWHRNVDLLAYHDLGGRSGFKLALQEADGGSSCTSPGSGTRAGASWT